MEGILLSLRHQRAPVAAQPCRSAPRAHAHWQPSAATPHGSPFPLLSLPFPPSELSAIGLAQLPSASHAQRQVCRELGLSQTPRAQRLRTIHTHTRVGSAGVWVSAGLAQHLRSVGVGTHSPAAFAWPPPCWGLAGGGCPRTALTRTAGHPVCCPPLAGSAGPGTAGLSSELRPVTA